MENDFSKGITVPQGSSPLPLWKSLPMLQGSGRCRELASWSRSLYIVCSCRCQRLRQSPNLVRKGRWPQALLGACATCHRAARVTRMQLEPPLPSGGWCWQDTAHTKSQQFLSLLPLKPEFALCYESTCCCIASNFSLHKACGTAITFACLLCLTCCPCTNESM